MVDGLYFSWLMTSNTISGFIYLALGISCHKLGNFLLVIDFYHRVDHLGSIFLC